MSSSKIVPPQNKPKNDRGYHEILIKAVFNAGFSYKVVEAKWKGITDVLENFDPIKISKWTNDDIFKAVNSPKIIRNLKKIKAIVENAKIFLNLTEKYGSFENYLKSMKNKSYEEVVKVISKQFKWLGPTGAHYFLWCVGEDVPPCEQVIKKS